MKSMVTIVRGKPSGQYTKWSEEGQKKVEGFYQGHKKHGWHVEWFDNGQMLSEGDYKNNNKNDWWTTWHNNGNIATSGNYKNNLKDGWWVEWYENGRKALELNYIEGIEESIFLEIKKHKELAAIAAKEKEDVEKQLSAAKRKLKQLKAKIEEATKKKELLEAERIALQEKFEDEQNVRALITEIQAEADADRRQVLEDIFNELKENYIGLMASKVRKEWRFMGAEDYWGCYVHIIQSEVGDVLSVNIQNCTIDDSSKAKSFKDSIERAVYRASPLPLAPDQDLFNAEVLFHFRVN